MTARPPRTSVIVLNYNGAAFIDRCLDAVSTQSGSFETVVVDNHSSDGSAESARRHPTVRVLALEANRGFAGGNNAGAAAAQATDYFVFLNNDTVAQPQWLDALVATLDARPDVALATSHIVSLKDPDVIDSAGDGYLWAGGAFKRWHGERTRPGAAVEEVFGACGASFAIRRSVFESLGGFDERFFMVYEDVDLSVPRQAPGASGVVRARFRRTSRRQCLTGPSERARRVLRAAQPRMGLAEEHAVVDPVAERPRARGLLHCGLSLLDRSRRGLDMHSREGRRRPWPS